MPPVKNPCVMTSYGGIIRIRLRVEVGLLPLSLLTQAPLYLFRLLLYTYFSKIQDVFCFFFTYNLAAFPNTGFIWKKELDSELSPGFDRIFDYNELWNSRKPMGTYFQYP